MAYNSINGYSTTRITGLTSGLDTDSLVQKLMQTEQAKYDRLFKANTKLEWKNDAYKGINTMLSDFRNKFMSATSKDNIFAASTYRAFNVNMTENKYLSIKATTYASPGSHNITGFRMAESATAEGAKHRNRSVSATGTSGENLRASTSGAIKLQDNWQGVALDQLQDADGNSFFDFTGSGDEYLKFSINGKEFSFKADSYSLDEVMDSVNRAGIDVKMSVGDDGKVSIASTVEGAKASLKLENVSGSPRVFANNGAFSTSHGEIKAESLISTSMTLEEIALATGKTDMFDSDGKLKFSINGEEFSFDKNMALHWMLDAVNNNSNANVTMAYDASSDQFTLRSDVSGANSKLDLKNVGDSKVFGDGGLLGIDTGVNTKYEMIDRQTDSIKTAAEKMGINLELDDKGKFSFTIKKTDADGEEISKDFTFDTSTSLQKMIDAVNGDSDLNVKLTYSQITDSFTFSSGDTGSDASFELVNKDGVNAFGGVDSFFGMGEGVSTGKNAVVMIDGERIEQASNSFVLDGIEFNLQTNFNSSIDENGEIVFGDAEAIDFSVSQDIDGVVDKVKAFVEEYNTIVQFLNTLIAEEVDYDYEPLTQDERDAMSTEEIENWESEAKKGVLRNDSTIKKLLSDMRTALFEQVGDTGLSPHDIGLTTGAWSNHGQISFDETKFRAALAENPDRVAQVMTGVSSSSDETAAYKESGIITRFYDQMTNFESTLKKYNIANTTEAISDNEDKMYDMLLAMYQMSEKYYQQFATMETLLTQYQSQSDWLTQQLSSLG